MNIKLWARSRQRGICWLRLTYKPCYAVALQKRVDVEVQIIVVVKAAVPDELLSRGRRSVNLPLSSSNKVHHTWRDGLGCGVSTYALHARPVVRARPACVAVYANRQRLDSAACSGPQARRSLAWLEPVVHGPEGGVFGHS